MAEAAENLLMEEAPDISHIVTEDDIPVDNMFSEKQQRLMAESLNSFWKPGRQFVAASNVGIFYGVHKPPIVPDMFLSMDVKTAEGMEIWEKKNRSYFIWEFGKPPELVVEVVSNNKGGEVRRKMKIYEHIQVLYYIVFDPQHMVQQEDLRVHELTAQGYIPSITSSLAKIGLGVTLWDGSYEGTHARWLRWCDHKGNIIPTGAEWGERQQSRADQKQKRADQEQKRAEEAEKRAEQSEKIGACSQAVETAQRMLRKGFAPDEICDLTGLSSQEVAELL